MERRIVLETVVGQLLQYWTFKELPTVDHTFDQRGTLLHDDSSAQSHVANLRTTKIFISR